MVQLIKYLAVGAFNTFLGYGIIFGCMYLLGMSPATSNMVGYGVGLAVSYVLHRRVTFESTGEKRREVARFLGTFAVAYLLNLGVLLALVYRLNVHEGMSQIIAGVIYIAASYLMQKFYVFRAVKAG